MLEVDEVHARVLIELQELAVDAVALGILRLRQHAGDVGLDEHGIQTAHDAYALVTLHDVEAVVVFKRGNRLAQALLDDAVIQQGPLARELGVDVEQREKGAGKSGRPALCGGTGDLAEADLHEAKRHLSEMVERGHELAEHGQSGVFAVQLHVVKLAQALLARGDIIVYGHE